MKKLLLIAALTLLLNHFIDLVKEARVIGMNGVVLVIG